MKVNLKAIAYTNVYFQLFAVQTFLFRIPTQQNTYQLHKNPMNQIRQKKEQQRKEIRREFLDNYFREMRRTCFHFEARTKHKTEGEKGVLEAFLQESLKINGMTRRMREEGMVKDIEELVGNAIKTGNLLQIRILLTIISNALKDQLTVDEKVTLYRFSSQLFQTLQLSHYNKQVQPQRQLFQKTLKTIHIQTLTFYISTITQTSPFLDQADQIAIQDHVYPAFLNVLIYTLGHPEELTSIDEFQTDVARFFRNLFDAKEEFYEQGNRIKAERLKDFYEDLLNGHLWVLDNCQGWQELFRNVELVLLRAYVKLIEALGGQVPDFMISKQFFTIMEFTLGKCSQKQTQTQLNFIHLILAIFIGQKLMLQHIQSLLWAKNSQTNVMVFERGINLIMENSQTRHRTLELVQAVVVCMFEDNIFRDIVQRHEISLVDMCAYVLSRFQKEMIGETKQRKMVSRVLVILRVLAEKQNIQGKKDGQSLVKRFESQSGKAALECISAWFNEVDVGDDEEIGNAIEYIEYILQLMELDIEMEVEE